MSNEEQRKKTISIRPATLSDADALVRFNIAIASETEHIDLHFSTVTAGVAGLFATPEFGFYLVAESEGEVIGSLMVTYEWSDWRAGVFWWIQSVYVKPEFRGMGVYKSLHEFVRTRAKADPKVCGLRLYVEKENVRAQKAYEKMGMTQAIYQIYEEPFQPLH